MSIESKILKWYANGDTGSSSKSLASFFSGHHEGPSDYPRDPDDFGRCYRFLRSVPELRPRIGEAAAMSKSWAALVGAWDELEGLYEKFCDADGLRMDAPGYAASKRMYDRMNPKLTHCERIQGLIYGKWRTPHEIQKELHALTGSWLSDSTITAYLRELRRKNFTVLCVPFVTDKPRWHYLIPKRKQAA